jgi:hypothetical protein
MSSYRPFMSTGVLSGPTCAVVATSFHPSRLMTNGSETAVSDILVQYRRESDTCDGVV